MKHHHFRFLKNKLSACFQEFLYVSLCASFECWWRIWGNPLDTATAQFNTQETTGSKNAKQTKLPYPKYSSSFLKISIIIIEFNKTVWRNDPGCLLCFIRSGWLTTSSWFVYKTQLVTTIRLISNEYMMLLFEYFKNK